MVKTVAVSSTSTIPQELARQGSRRLAVFKGDLTVDQDPVVSPGLLNPPPLAPGQVFGHFRGQNFQLFEVIHDDVRGGVLPEGATVLEAADNSTCSAHPLNSTSSRPGRARSTDLSDRSRP